MADYERLSKIQKLEENAENDVFTSFHTRHKDKMDTLRRAYGKLSENSSAFKAIEIVSSDCTKSRTFTTAYLDVKEHTERIYIIGPIFESGLRHLYNFLHRREIPEDNKTKEILSSLLNYLMDEGKQIRYDYIATGTFYS